MEFLVTEKILKDTLIESGFDWQNGELIYLNEQNQVVKKEECSKEGNFDEGKDAEFYLPVLCKQKNCENPITMLIELKKNEKAYKIENVCVERAIKNEKFYDKNNQEIGIDYAYIPLGLMGEGKNHELKLNFYKIMLKEYGADYSVRMMKHYEDKSNTYKGLIKEDGYDSAWKSVWENRIQELETEKRDFFEVLKHSKEEGLCQ